MIYDIKIVSIATSENFMLPNIGLGLTLTERVHATIKAAILELKLKPGSPLVEDELARQLGTSKTPIRDALLVLEHDGLVTKIPKTHRYRFTHKGQLLTAALFATRRASIKQLLAAA